MRTIPDMQLLLCNQHHLTKACRCWHAHRCCYATNITQLSMPLLPCTQCQTYRCCYATNITQLKHATVSMHTIPNIQMLLCNQYHSAKTCCCCHAHRCCYATNITQLKHAAVAVHTIPKTQPLLCSQYHSAKACSCCHVHNTRHELLLCNQ